MHVIMMDGDTLEVFILLETTLLHSH